MRVAKAALFFVFNSLEGEGETWQLSTVNRNGKGQRSLLIFAVRI